MRSITKISTFIVCLCLFFSSSNLIYAQSIDELHSNSENLIYLSDGSYTYELNGDIYFYDAETNETILAVEKSSPSVTLFARSVSHTPANLEPHWIWWQTDGPYSVSINMSAVNRILKATASWAEVSVALALPAALLQWAYEAANGNFNINQTVWEIDDAYYFYTDYGYQRTESYFYSDANCTNLVDRDSFTYHSSW